MKVSARDVALVTISAFLGAGLALIVRLPKVPDENNMLGLIGSLIGSAVAVAVGLIVIARQFETTDERNLRTIRGLLRALNLAGTELQTEGAVLNPPRYVHDALTLFRAAKSVSAELRATSAPMAIVAQMFEDEHVHGQLIQFHQGAIGINAANLANLGAEVVDIAGAGLHALGE